MTSLIHRFPFLADLLNKSAADRLEDSSRVAASSFPSAARTNYPALEERRGAAMRRLFPKLYSWCASRWEWSIAMDVHAYLSAATSLEDLEQRIRTVERSRSFGPS